MANETDPRAGADDDALSLENELLAAIEGDPQTGDDDASELEADVAAAADAGAGQPRDEHGRFATKAERKAEEAQAQAEQPARQEQHPEAAQADQNAPQPVAERPPPGWSPASKAEFDKLPASVRADIARREAEVDAGFKRYAGLGQFAEEAERYGTNLGDVVARYRAVDRLFESNFIGGIEAVCAQYRVDPRLLTQHLMGRYGAGESPAAQEQYGAHQQPYIDPNAIVQQARQEMRAELERNEAQSQIAQFSANPANKFFDNVKREMAVLIQSGTVANLQDAYDRACWAHPEIRSILMREQAGGGANAIAQKAAAANQARAASKSIRGAPSAGAKPAGAPQSSIEDDLRAAWNNAVGAV